MMAAMSEQPDPPSQPSRFMKLGDVAAELLVTQAQVYALVRNGTLPAIKIGGRGQWRIERSKLEEFIVDAYSQTAQFILDTPFGKDEDTPPEDNEPDLPSEPTQPPE
jgi:excisionase family DNA binding protein